MEVNNNAELFRFNKIFIAQQHIVFYHMIYNIIFISYSHTSAVCLCVGLLYCI